MKRLLSFLLCSGALACAGDLSTAKTVYVLSMSRGMDQYLANRLTNGRVLQVVTDPKLADVILTDHIGEGFEAKLADIFPAKKDAADSDAEEPAPPPPGKPGAKDAPAGKGPVNAKDAPAGKNGPPSKDAGPPSSNPMFGQTVNKLSNPSLISSFDRAKGNIFLVDSKTREVVWSTYDPPKSSAGKDLNRTASAIVSRLKKDLTKK